MTEAIAIVGAGVLGRMTALELARRGAAVTLFDAGPPEGQQSASFAAAGLLSPYCEQELGSGRILRLGVASLERWPEILKHWDPPVFFRRDGSLVVAFPSDRHELDRLRRRVDRSAPGAYRELRDEALRSLEPELDPRFRHALHFPDEGQLDNRELLVSSVPALARAGVTCHFGCEVLPFPFEVSRRGERLRYDRVVDCRGLGARADERALRGVRGELLHLEAPEVRLERPVRLMHPRYAIYVAPRPDRRYLVGATCIESEDRGPITVRSVVELLSAAFALHTGFGEARVIQSAVGLRPAYPDNEPRLGSRPGLLRINGLYRHGFLLSPRVAELAADYLEHGRIDAEELSVEEAA